MKKFNILLLGALGLLAGACAEDIEPSKPQQNPQEPILNVAEDVVSEKAGVLASTDLIALEDYNQPEAKIPVMKLEEVKNLPAGAEVVYKLVLSTDDDFTNTQTLVASPSTEDPSIYVVDAAEWQQAQINLFGETVKVQTCYYRVPVYLSLSGSEYRLDSMDYYAAQGVFQITRMYPGYVVEDEYFIFGNNIGGNSPATAVQMNHPEGVDAYDDPVFYNIFTVSDQQAADGYTMMICPGSLHNSQATASQCFGTDTPNAASGNLILGGQPITWNFAGPYKINVDMKNLTYSIVAAPEVLYAPSEGAKFNKKCLPLHSSDYITYTGLTYLDTHFTITGQKSWKPIAYGQGASENVLKQIPDGMNMEEGFPVKTKGEYWMNVNLAKMTVEYTFIKTLGLTGSFNGWAQTGDPVLKPDTNYNKWTGEITCAEDALNADGEFEWKIRANEDWAINFGEGEGNSAVPGGANWKQAGAGTYTVVFDCSVYPYTVTITKK